MGDGAQKWGPGEFGEDVLDLPPPHPDELLKDCDCSCPVTVVVPELLVMSGSESVPVGVWGGNGGSHGGSSWRGPTGT